MKLISLTLMLVSLTCAVSAQSLDVHALARAVDDHYNRLRSLQAEFTETYSGAGAERAESGTLWLKKPGKMRWLYRSPREKLFVSDGKDVWFYLPADRQVRKTSLKKLDDLRSPLAFLLGKTKLEKELRGLAAAPDQPPMAGGVVLRGVPRGMENRVNDVVLEITGEHKIARIRLEQADGSVTEFRLENQQENVALTDEQFRFQAPDGTETVEGEFGQ